MFDFDAGKLLIIGIIALIVIGPKELPAVLRQLGQMVARMRRMAAEFQSQFAEAMREAELQDLQKDVEKVHDFMRGDLNPLTQVNAELNAAKNELNTAAHELPRAFDMPQDMLTMSDVTPLSKSSPPVPDAPTLSPSELTQIDAAPAVSKQV